MGLLSPELSRYTIIYPYNPLFTIKKKTALYVGFFYIDVDAENDDKRKGEKEKEQKIFPSFFFPRVAVFYN